MTNRRSIFVTCSVLAIFLIVGCSARPIYTDSPKVKKVAGKSDPKRNFKVGQKWTGHASFYGPKFDSLTTANGEHFDMNGISAAHKHLPFNTILKVTNLANNKQINVRINDRGPFIKGRMLDLSKGAAMKIGMLELGVAEVEVQIITLGD